MFIFFSSEFNVLSVNRELSRKIDDRIYYMNTSAKLRYWKERGSQQI